MVSKMEEFFTEIVWAARKTLSEFELTETPGKTPLSFASDFPVYHEPSSVDELKKNYSQMMTLVRAADPSKTEALTQATQRNTTLFQSFEQKILEHQSARNDYTATLLECAKFMAKSYARVETQVIDPGGFFRQRKEKKSIVWDPQWFKYNDMRGRFALMRNKLGVCIEQLKETKKALTVFLKNDESVDKIVLSLPEQIKKQCWDLTGVRLPATQESLDKQLAVYQVVLDRTKKYSD